jgi:iron complex transport system substrate-binding protein
MLKQSSRKFARFVEKLCAASGFMLKPKTKPHRIVSLAPNVTSILCAIGARRQLVGVTRWCRDVANVGKLPLLGDCWRVESIDAIAKLRPSLIVGSVPFHPDAVRRILEIPAQFLALNPRSLADIESDIQTLALITNRAANGRRLIRHMRTEFAKIQRLAAKSAHKPRVYSEAWPNPRISSPPWVSEMVEVCGGKMVPQPGAKVSDQEVAAAQPDIILLAWAATGNRSNPRKTLSNPLWQKVPAILHQRVFVIPDELLNTPGPPLIAGARQIFRILRNHSGASE